MATQKKERTFESAADNLGRFQCLVLRFVDSLDPMPTREESHDTHMIPDALHMQSPLGICIPSLHACEGVFRKHFFHAAFFMPVSTHSAEIPCNGFRIRGAHYAHPYGLMEDCAPTAHLPWYASLLSRNGGIHIGKAKARHRVPRRLLMLIREKLRERNPHAERQLRTRLHEGQGDHGQRFLH